MKALSIKQPWLWAITDLDKRVENRTWRPPKWAIGQRIALHASKKDDLAGAPSIHRITGQFTAPHIPRGAIVATAVVADYCDNGRRLDRLPVEQDRWFFGPIGWILDDVRKLSEPVPCRGHLGLWDVPAELLDEVMA